MIDKHPNSKIVTIFRAGSFLSRAQGPAVEDHFASSKVSVGSYFESANSTMVGSGLTFQEQELLMPVLVDAPKEDREFRKLVRSYFEGIDTKVPHNTGCVLEIGLEKSNEEPVSATNMPIKLIDFVRYRHAYHHPFMAHTKEEAEGNPLMQFYIFDKSQVQNKLDKRTQTSDAAMQIYLAIKKDLGKVNMMLTLLGEDIREYPLGDEGDTLKVNKLRSISVATPERFIEIHDGEDMEIRYWIESMRQAKILLPIGMKYVDGETKKVIGNTLEETIFFFKDDDNSEVVTLLKARLQEAQRQPIQAEKRRTRPLPTPKI